MSKLKKFLFLNGKEALPSIFKLTQKCAAKQKCLEDTVKMSKHIMKIFEFQLTVSRTTRVTFFY